QTVPAAHPGSAMPFGRMVSLSPTCTLGGSAVPVGVTAAAVGDGGTASESVGAEDDPAEGVPSLPCRPGVVASQTATMAARHRHTQRLAYIGASAPMACLDRSSRSR